MLMNTNAKHSPFPSFRLHETAIEFCVQRKSSIFKFSFVSPARNSNSAFSENAQYSSFPAFRLHEVVILRSVHKLKVSSVLIRSTEFIKVPVLEADCLDSTDQKKGRVCRVCRVFARWASGLS